jgi:hypothetical protein
MTNTPRVTTPTTLPFFVASLAALNHTPQSEHFLSRFAMNSQALSQHPIVTRLMKHINHDLHCTQYQCIDSDDTSEVSLVLTRIMAPCHTDALHLTQFLTQNGYQFCDATYTKNGYIHAKFDTEFNIWADTREPVEPGQSLTVDFSGEFSIGEENCFVDNEDEFVKLLLSRIVQAINAFDSSLRESREDLVRIFGPAHPWDWAHRQGILFPEPN